MIKPVRWSVTALVAVIGAGIVWIAFSALDAWGTLPPVPVATVWTVGGLAVIVGGTAWWTHRHLQVRRAHIEPRRALALLACGRAAILAGFGLAGAYLGIVAYSVRRLDAALPRERFLIGLLAAVLSLGLGIAGRALERACRVHDSDSDDDEDADSTNI